MRRYRFIRSRRKIEIDITWQCNLTCFDCNRCLGEAPTADRMELSQIESFLSETIKKNYKWDVIRLVGGEPTLHPDFLEIIDRFVKYKRSIPNNEDSPVIELLTNGYGSRTKALHIDMINFHLQIFH